jgi:single-strand DNA-binding protein
MLEQPGAKEGTMLNRIQLIGRLTRDPELRYVSNGNPMAQFTLAVDRDFRNAAGDREADFIPCVTWRKLAELVGQYCARGRLVAVEGRLQTRTYEAQDGSRRRKTEVVGDRVWFLDSPRADGERAGAEQPADTAASDGPPEVLVEADASGEQE